MPEYKRINFKEEWAEEIREYLRENPEEGFTENDLKSFIKFATNRYMNQDNIRTKQFEKLRNKLDEKLEEIED